MFAFYNVFPTSGVLQSDWPDTKVVLQQEVLVNFFLLIFFSFLFIFLMIFYRYNIVDFIVVIFSFGASIATAIMVSRISNEFKMVRTDH